MKLVSVTIVYWNRKKNLLSPSVVKAFGKMAIICTMEKYWNEKNENGS